MADTDARTSQRIEASDVSRLAGSDHKLYPMFEAALRACGYYYNINEDAWFWRVSN